MFTIRMSRRVLDSPYYTGGLLIQQQFRFHTGDVPKVKYTEGSN